MALGKSRSSRRSSSSSYMPTTVTMTVFIVFCVVGLWMITSKSVITPHITRTTNPFITSSPIPLHLPKFIEIKKGPPAFDDSQGDLPDDAIKGDIEDHKSNETNGSATLPENVRDTVAEIVSNNNSEEKQEKEKSLVAEEKPQIEETKNLVEDEKQEQKQETQILEENNLNQQNQQMPTNSNVESEETQKSKDEQIDENQDQIQQQTVEIEGNNIQNQTQKEVDQSQQDTEIESNNEIEENLKQPNQVISEEKHPQETQKKITEATNIETQKQDSKPEIQELTNHETQQLQETATMKEKHTYSNSTNSVPDVTESVIPNESSTSVLTWSTQADQSGNEKERQKGGIRKNGTLYEYAWKLCNVRTGPDYIPCLDNEKALKQLHTTGHFEHRERHCPEEAPTCLVPIPKGYKRSIAWPGSRYKIWYRNVPHTKLAEVKGHQNWVKVTGEFLTFPGGGTQFIHGALHYIDFIQKSAPNIAWGRRSRVVLDVGCGVASFGGYLFDRDVLTMSFAPKDEHEAQVQLALERGIPAISAVMGSQRLPFPSMVFDIVHCARCRVPWHVEGGRLLLELNRVLRPGGYFVWSATPVYRDVKEDVEIWKAMSSLTSSMCWKLLTIKKDKLNGVGIAIYRKPVSNECYDNRKQKRPRICKEDNHPNAAWYVPLRSCMHRVPVDVTQRGGQWPENWPRRLHMPPYWLNKSQMGIYGRPAPEDFEADYKHWKQVVSKSYLNNLGINWSNVRNVMDMRAVYGGFAAALKDLKVWVLNVVSINSPDTLPIIYERGLLGIYHDWCESFSTYPRSYDLLHVDHLFSRLKKRCRILPVMAEIDRIVRPGGKLIVCDESNIIMEIENVLKSLHWEILVTFSKNQEVTLSAQKSDWRPDAYSASS